MLQGVPPALIKKPCFHEPDKYSGIAVEFVAACCTMDPEKRPTAAGLFGHNFVYEQSQRTSNPLENLIMAHKGIKEQQRKLDAGYQEEGRREGVG
jgi:serine/threonine protein kinase